MIEYTVFMVGVVACLVSWVVSARKKTLTSTDLIILVGVLTLLYLGIAHPEVVKWG